MVDCHDEKTDPCAWRARAQMSATYEPGPDITTRNSASMAQNLRDRVLGALHGLYSISNSTVFRIGTLAKQVAEKFFLGQTAVSWVTSSRLSKANNPVSGRSKGYLHHVATFAANRFARSTRVIVPLCRSTRRSIEIEAPAIKKTTTARANTGSHGMWLMNAHCDTPASGLFPLPFAHQTICPVFYTSRNRALIILFPPCSAFQERTKTLRIGDIGFHILAYTNEESSLEVTVPVFGNIVSASHGLKEFRTPLSAKLNDSLNPENLG